jgi:hypothetical protein
MKIFKIIDLILLIIVSIIGVVYEIHPPIIPDWLFNAIWVVGSISMVLLGVILYLEKKQNKKQSSDI